MIQRTFGGGSLGGKQQSLEAPGFTPWFDVWIKFTLCSVPTGTADHEFLRHHLGCIFVISSSANDPVEQLQRLSEQQYRHQHEKAGISSNGTGGIYPQYLSTNILKYYVVIHDAFEVDDSAAQKLFTKVQTAFGSNYCHLLSINSRTGQLLLSNIKEEDKTTEANCNAARNGNPGVADYWISHLQTHKFSNVETRFSSIIGESSNNSKSSNVKTGNTTSINKYGQNPAIDKTTSNHSLTKNEQNISKNHPLANNDTSDDVTGIIDRDDEKGPKDSFRNSNPLAPVTSSNVALLLNSNDIDRIRAFIKEFVIKGLIPYLEKQMRTLQEIVTNRKSRSLFSGAKKWFSGAAVTAGNRAGAGSLLGGAAAASGIGGGSGGTSIVYTREAPELQMRRLGDIYFMLKLYKLAYNCYHIVKRDFQSDEAWNYYAGAAEMAAISQFMQGNSIVSDNIKLPSSQAGGVISNSNPTKYPAHYMEDAITKYLSVCQMPEFALRATVLDALCFKHQGMFQEAAMSFIRMTNESKDLRSALLLEQAAYCYLLGAAPLVRKYAFHIILSGYRFSKSGQKMHSSRTYRQGFQIYKGHDWSLAEDHILYSLGHQSLLLKDHYTAANLFNELLSNTYNRSNTIGTKHLPYVFGGVSRLQTNTNPLQQMCHLREFFIVHHMREKEDKKVATITIPCFLPQECVLNMAGKSIQKESESNVLNVSSYNLIETSYETLINICENTALGKQQPSRFEMERVIAERIFGQENMTQTCQTVFGPNSDNTLPPQGIVGERIRLILPAKNLFQTPLLLKQIHIIWKFTPANASMLSDLSLDKWKSNDVGENGDVISIYSDKTPFAEAEKLVKTDMVESVLLSGDSTALIDLGLIPRQPGSLTILGVQYAIKAQFPQSESTDYTIRGRQYLKVHGPRLMQTKDQRTNKNPFYNKDIRIGHPIEIIPCDDQALPNIGVELCGWPKGIFQGEMRKIDLKITNLTDIDQVSVVNRINLVHHHPGLFATEGNKISQKYWEKSKHSSETAAGLPFKFPVILDPALTITKDGSSKDTFLDILPIDIKDGSSTQRHNKTVTNIPVWICGPSQIGHHTFTLYFYYEASKSVKKPPQMRRPLQYRMIRVDLSTIVHPSFTLSAIRSPVCMHENDLSETVLVHIINTGGGNQPVHLESIKISQISLISSRNYALCEILSDNEESMTLTRGQAHVFCLKSIIRSSKHVKDDNEPFNDVGDVFSDQPNSCQFSISQLRASQFVSQDNQTDNLPSYSLNNSPYIDFVKGGFSFTEKSKILKAVELERDLLVVSWQGLFGNTKVGNFIFVKASLEK